MGGSPGGWSALALGSAAAVGFLYLAGGQIIFGNSNLLVAGYGWHNYFLYFPLAWVIYTYFERADVERLMRQTLLVAIPISALVAAQFYSPSDSFINKGIEETGGKVFEVAHGIVRPYGTFTFVAGQSLFVSSVVAMLLANVLRKPLDRFLRGPALLGSVIACAVMVMLSGSRTSFILSAILGCFALLASLLGTDWRDRLRGIVLPAGVAVVLAGLYPVVFPTSFQAMVERQETAVDAEGATEDRAIHTLTDTVDVFGKVPVFGYGMGFGTAGGAALAGLSGFTLSENEFPRIVEEVGPIFGVVYIVLRLCLAGYLLLVGMRAARRANDPGVLCISGFTFVLLATLQVTFEGTVNGYAWVFSGLSLALGRLALSVPPVAPAREAAVVGMAKVTQG